MFPLLLFSIPFILHCLRSALRYIHISLTDLHTFLQESNTSEQKSQSTTQVSDNWDCSLHLPLWVPKTEQASIEAHLDKWTNQIETSGADITSLASSLKKPLRPLWISQKTIIWLNEVPDHDSWDFTPIILVSASSLSGFFQQRTSSEFSWNYISGAGDDEESWARGLSPNLFWNYVYDIINSGPDLCNQKVADIVEKDRVYRSQRGLNAPQVSVKHSKFSGGLGHSFVEDPLVDFEIPASETNGNSLSNGCEISWLGSTNLAVCATQHGMVIYLLVKVSPFSHTCIGFYFLVFSMEIDY